MRRDVAAELEHDLSVPGEPDGRRVVAATLAVHEGEQRAAETRDPVRAEPLAPEAEEVAERQPCPGADLDDARRLERPGRIGAPAGREPREVLARGAGNADPGR